jgi:hypothetical protein
MSGASSTNSRCRGTVEPGGRHAARARCREEIHEEADGRHDRGGAVRRCRGAGARTELGVGADRSPAREVQAKAEDAGGRHVTVKVINWRNVDLVELQAAVSGSANWKKVLGALKAGQWTSAKVPQSNNCRADLHGKYADGQLAEASNVDVCADKTVNLTN